MRDKNPIIKKTDIPFRDLRSLRVPYAGNCAPDHEKLNIKGNCNCVCDCDCHCDCYYSQDCACDCEQSFCDCNCVCDCGGWVKEGVLLIPEGAKRIYASTYKERGQIREVVLPEGLEVIEPWAFARCKSLHRVNFPEGLLRIEGMAFSACAIKEAILPDSLQEIRGFTFTDCELLRRLHIGKSLRAIGTDGPFSGCERLSEITVDEENPHFKVVDGVLFSKDGKILYCYPEGRSGTEYIVPDGVTTIWPCAFYKNERLQSVIFPDGLTEIGAGAFEFTKRLERISLPTSLRHLRSHAFAFSSKLESVEFRGKRAEWRPKRENYDFSLNDRRERPTIRTQDGMGWSL